MKTLKIIAIRDKANKIYTFCRKLNLKIHLISKNDHQPMDRLPIKGEMDVFGTVAELEKVKDYCENLKVIVEIKEASDKQKQSITKTEEWLKEYWKNKVVYTINDESEFYENNEYVPIEEVRQPISTHKGLGETLVSSEKNIVLTQSKKSLDIAIKYNQSKLAYVDKTTSELKNPVVMISLSRVKNRLNLINKIKNKLFMTIYKESLNSSFSRLMENLESLDVKVLILTDAHLLKTKSKKDLLNIFDLLNQIKDYLDIKFVIFGKGELGEIFRSNKKFNDSLLKIKVD